MMLWAIRSVSYAAESVTFSAPGWIAYCAAHADVESRSGRSSRGRSDFSPGILAPKAVVIFPAVVCRNRYSQRYPGLAFASGSGIPEIAAEKIQYRTTATQN